MAWTSAYPWRGWRLSVWRTISSNAPGNRSLRMLSFMAYLV